MKTALCALIGAVAAVTMCTAAIADDRVYVTVNGEELVTDVPAKVMYDRTMLPVRAIFEGIGAEVDWNADTKTVTGKKNDKVVSMSVNSNIVNIGGVEVAMDVMPVVVENRVLVPARYVAESFDLKVDWNAESKEVAIYDAEHSQATTKVQITTEAVTEATTQRVVVHKAETTTEATTTTETTTVKQDRNLTTGINQELIAAVKNGFESVKASYVMGKTNVSDKTVNELKEQWNEICFNDADKEYAATALKIVDKLDSFYSTTNNFVMWRKNSTAEKLCNEYLNKAYSYMDSYTKAYTVDKANSSYIKIVACYNEYKAVILKETNSIS